MPSYGQPDEFVEDLYPTLVLVVTNIMSYLPKVN